jgi:NAD(P) transhydrogenase subunit alpha
VIVNGVTVLGPVNLPSSVPQHASQMYSRNVLTFVQYALKDGALNVDLADAITGPMCVTHAGELRTQKAA